MPRPKPRVVAEITSKTTYRTDQTIVSSGLWAVFYDGEPINLKSFNNYGGGTKYKKVAFSNSAPAVNLCEKLNRDFKTSKFAVFKLSKGEQIFP